MKSPFPLFAPILLLLAACHSPATQPAPGASGDPASGVTIDLLASQDLGDWDHVLADPAAAKEAVWSFNPAGQLVCTGQPKGFLATREAYTNFRLVVEWRWPEAPSNSGVLLRIQSNEPIPTCVEAQLKSGSAGYLMGLRGARLQGPNLENRTSPNIGDLHIVPKQAGEERPAGEWNRYEITVMDDTVCVQLNGEWANEARGAEVLAGPIGFQSEGGAIEFRTIELTPLD